ncbi:MAG: hypothetical protein WEF86_02580 [Gemmatimonadota bacterium]
MPVLLLLLVVFALLVALGRWRRFGAVQWIWLLFGSAIALVIIWVILLVFVIGPEMQRTGPPG